VRVIDAESLTGSNLAYREPALYDELLADSSLATDLVALAAHQGIGAQTALDLGCGTGRLLAELRDHGLTGTGVDVQPDLIAWARDARPGLRLEVGDLRTIRLGTTFDLVVCVGNTLSYLHTEAELAAAFDTIAAHSHSGTLVGIATLTGVGRDARGSGEISTSLGPATVDTASRWDPATGIVTSRRTWRFGSGRVEHDTMRRRCWSRDALIDLACRVGFTTIDPSSTELTFCAVRRR
jgi:SAM-dependent methyltransferase